MIRNEEILLYMERRRLDALKAALSNTTGESVSEKLQEALLKLYQECVPDMQRATIESEISADEIKEQAEMEARRRFAVYHIREGGEDALFRSDIFSSPMLAANRYRLYQRDELEDRPALFAKAFADAERITPREYTAACDDRYSDNRITAILEFDLDEGTVSICDSGDHAWNTYRLHDFSVAAFKAYRSDYRTSDARREIFNHSLIGKEIEFDEANEETPAEDDGEDEAPVMRM